MDQKKLYFNWSTGKDSALALYYLMQQDTWKVDHLLTTVNGHLNRVTMHGLRRELLEAQVRSLGIPYSTVELPEQPDMEVYNQIMQEKTEELKSAGYDYCAFGDIFLEDLRRYREDQLAKQQIMSIYPLWKKDTRKLMREFLALGFKAIVICASSEYFREDFVGSVLDQKLIDALPAEVDPCGENGEFHTFCYDGPIFERPIAFTKGEKILRTYKNPQPSNSDIGFWYCDILAVRV